MTEEEPTVLSAPSTLSHDEANSAEDKKPEEKKTPNRRWRRALQLAIRRNKNKQPGDRFRCGTCGLRFVAPTAERCQCSVAKPGQVQISYAPQPPAPLIVSKPPEMAGNMPEPQPVSLDELAEAGVTGSEEEENFKEMMAANVRKIAEAFEITAPLIGATNEAAPRELVGVQLHSIDLITEGK